jgi:hypothetical protein
MVKNVTEISLACDGNERVRFQRLRGKKDFRARIKKPFSLWHGAVGRSAPFLSGVAIISIAMLSRRTLETIAGYPISTASVEMGTRPKDQLLGSLHCAVDVVFNNVFVTQQALSSEKRKMIATTSADGPRFDIVLVCDLAPTFT